MTRRMPGTALCGAICAGALWACLFPATAAGQPGARVDLAVEAGARWLAARITPSGQAAGEYASDHRHHLFGGRTALCAHALLEAGRKPTDPPVLRALNWLADAKLDGTYPVAMRACALASSRDPSLARALEADAKWLVRAAGRDGQYTYTPLAGAESVVYDNSSGQMAAMGVFAAGTRGVEVPESYWRRVRQRWVDQQQADGGWGYFIPPGRMRTRSYGSMTAAGLATLYACFDSLRTEQFVRCREEPTFKPIADAHAWLERNLRIDENPRKGVQWYEYWLFSLQRVGRASGYKYLGGRDWYALGSAALLDRQNDDGSWGFGDEAQRIEPTALAVLFLAGGRSPVLVSKLRYDGKWNSRPRDAANLVRWLSRTFERPLAWQVVATRGPAGGTMADFSDAPVLYVSGAGAWEPTEADVAALREFALRGGLILSEAACNSGSFTIDMRRLHTRLFPDWPTRPLNAKHPVYTLQFRPDGFEGIAAVSNGVRLLAVHAPRELSLALQRGPRDATMPTFQLLANLYQYATDRGQLRPRGVTGWPEDRPFEPAQTLRVARVRHDGNCDPEPIAWRRLALVAAQRRLRLIVEPPVEPGKLDVAKTPVAAMTGTADFRLPREQARALTDYLAGWGTLIVDAAGGSRAFAVAVEREILGLLGEQVPRPLPDDHAAYAGLPKGAARFRSDFAQTLGPEAGKPRLVAVRDGERPAIIFSPDDLTAGLLGRPIHGVRGYKPEVAVELMLNLLGTAAR